MPMSEQVNEIASALAKAQAEFKPVPQSGYNSHYKSKYSTLGDCWDSVRESLGKHGLAVTQIPSVTALKEVMVETFILHSSGQWLSGTFMVNPDKKDLHGVGSALSYAKRYSFCGLLGVASIEADDDANAAVEQDKRRSAEVKAQQRDSRVAQDLQKARETAMALEPSMKVAAAKVVETKPLHVVKPLSDAQLKRLAAISRENNWTDEDQRNYVKLTYGKASRADLTYNEYNQFCAHIAKFPKQPEDESQDRPFPFEEQGFHGNA